MPYIFLLLIFLLSLQKIISIIGKYDKHYWTRKNLNVRHTTKAGTSVCLAMTWCRVTWYSEAFRITSAICAVNTVWHKMSRTFFNLRHKIQRVFQWFCKSADDGLLICVDLLQLVDWQLLIICISISIWLLSHVLNRVNRFFHSNYLYFITKANIKLCEAYVWVMFRTAVCIFRTAECTFRSGERTFRSAEHRLDV